MKKLTTVLLTLTFVFGVAAMSSAACFNCNGEAGNIARGCEGLQSSCYPFDFENMWDGPNSYCEKGKTSNRALFKICDCIPDTFDTLNAGDTVDISMEILVDSGNGPETGDNGVYWAEDIDSNDGVGLGTYENQSDACKDRGYPEEFAGPFKYLKADGKTGYPYEGSDCDLTDLDSEDDDFDEEADDARVVKMVADRVLANELDITTGYEISEDDDLGDRATWAIDIPRLRADVNKVEGGEKVWVKICLYRYTDGICGDLPCCCEIYIGELCCDSIRQSSGLIYPYFPPANSETWNLIGMTITNLSDAAGEAVVTVYESDGTVGTITVEVPAKGIFLTTLSALVADPAIVKTGTGDLGDSKCYIEVMPDFEATGFVMIADTIDGASMGYLPHYGYGDTVMVAD